MTDHAPEALATESSTSTESPAEAHFDALLEAAPDAIVVMSEDGRIQTFSPSAERMFGYRMDEVIGRRIGVLMPSPYRSEHSGYVRRYLETGVAQIIGKGRRVRAKRKDGTTFPVYLAVGDAVIDGRHHFVGIIHDLTRQTQVEREHREEQVERRRAEVEADQLRATLAHVGRLGLMGEMATSIAHEINQPLAAIGNYAQACRLHLREDAPDLEEIEGIINQIDRSARLAGEVIRQLRDFVRKRESERERLGIDRLIDEVMAFAEIEARLGGVALEVSVAENLPEVEAEKVQIQQVLLNLIHNALDASRDLDDPARRRVSVSAEVREGDVEAGEVRVSVRDRGAGVDPGLDGQLFRPFFTTKESGLGMGLSICRSILEGHGGRIWFSRNDDEDGSTFHFTLPVAPGETGTAGRRSA